VYACCVDKIPKSILSFFLRQELEEKDTMERF